MKKRFIGLFCVVIGSVSTFIFVSNKNKNIIAEQVKKIEKFRSYYNVLNQWLMVKQDGKNIGTYFKNADFKSIAIYGMGELGERLIKEVKASGITVKYILNTGQPTKDADWNEVDPELTGIDAVIVTAIAAFEEIKTGLENKVSCPIISLEEIIYSI